MHSQLYAHKTVRAARAMLNFILWKTAITIGDTLSVRPLCDIVYMLGSRLDTADKQLHLDSSLTESIVNRRQPQLSDNLPYFESDFVRSLSAIGNDATVKMGEKLVARELYKEVYCVSDDSLSKFVKEILASPKGSSKRVCSDPEVWSDLIQQLSDIIGAALNTAQQSQVMEVDMTEQLPLALIDVAIPKTMRNQKPLYLAQDKLGDELSWARIEELHLNTSTEVMMPGIVVRESLVYEAFGGNKHGESDLIGPPSIRVFCHPRIADRVRTYVREQTITSFLRTFKTSNKTLKT